LAVQANFGKKIIYWLDDLAKYFSNFDCSSCTQQIGGVFMNKMQLIEKIAKETSLTKTQAEAVLNSAFGQIKTAVKKGDDVKLVGFGTFTKNKRKARMGRNPQTGKAIKIPAAWAPKFRAGAEFKAICN
jgi:DNA-binding protein HU-beta